MTVGEQTFILCPLTNEIRAKKAKADDLTDPPSSSQRRRHIKAGTAHLCQRDISGTSTADRFEDNQVIFSANRLQQSKQSTLNYLATIP